MNHERVLRCDGVTMGANLTRRTALASLRYSPGNVGMVLTNPLNISAKKAIGERIVGAHRTNSLLVSGHNNPLRITTERAIGKLRVRMQNDL